MMKQHLFLTLSLLNGLLLFSQSTSVAPTRVFFSNELGESRVKTVSVMNKTQTPQSYQVTFLDFEVTNKKGKPTLLEAKKDAHSISPWISASPSFFTLQPGATEEIKVTLDLPNTPEAYKVKWGAMSIKLAKEQSNPLDQQNKQLGMAIVNTFQIIVYMFQSPPSITEKSAEIYDFRYMQDTNSKQVFLAAENTSPSILDCHTYLEFTNLKTGWSHTSDKKRFTLLPDGAKEILFELPSTIPQGQYSIMGVVDYGSSSEIKAAELEININ